MARLTPQQSYHKSSIGCKIKFSQFEMQVARHRRLSLCLAMAQNSRILPVAEATWKGRFRSSSSTISYGLSVNNCTTASACKHTSDS